MKCNTTLGRRTESKQLSGRAVFLGLNPTCVQSSSVTQSCPALGDPMDCSTPGFPVHHQLPELAQTHVHWVSDAIQPPHPLSPPSPLLSIFPSIRVFSKESVFVIRWPKYWSFSISPSNAQSRLIFYTIDWFDLFRYHRIFRITLGSCLDISFGSFYLSIYPLIQVNWIHKSINLQTIPIYWFIIGDTNSTIKIYEVSHSWQGARYICRKMDASGLY